MLRKIAKVNCSCGQVVVECYEQVSYVASLYNLAGPGPWAAEGSQVLKHVIGSLSAALLIKIITWN